MNPNASTTFASKHILMDFSYTFKMEKYFLRYLHYEVTYLYRLSSCANSYIA